MIFIKEGKLTKRTISTMVGKGSLSHNRRTFYAENVDPSRTHLNIKYCDQDTEQVYHELFDDAVERYNAKQKRSDRKIKDYHEKIRTGKQEKLFHEVVVQIGNKDDCGSGTPEGDIAAEKLVTYKRRDRELQKQVDQLKNENRKKDSLIDKLKGIIDGLKKEITELKQRLSGKESLHDRLEQEKTKAENEDLKKENQRLREKLALHGIPFGRKCEDRNI